MMVMHKTILAHQPQPAVTEGWDPESKDRCVVCDRPAKGKAICNDPECANVLASG